MKKVVLALAKSENQVQRAINDLIQSGIRSENISVLLANKRNEVREFKTSTKEYALGSEETIQERDLGKTSKLKSDLGIENSTKAPEGATGGAITGGILGGALGLLAGIGSIAIPGLGALVAAGPLLGLLSGSAVGGGLGLLIGALTGLGIPEYEAKQYEKGLQEGHILLAIEAQDSNEVSEITNLLKNLELTNISTTTEKTKSR